MVDRTRSDPSSSAACKDSHERVLTEKEQVYLSAVQLNQKHLVEELMYDPEVDPCCVDYMGRSALILSIWAGNIDLIDMLLYRLEKKNFSAIEDALLYAVSLEKTHIVKLIIDHPSFVLNEKTYALVRSRLGQVHRSEERSQFSPDITPLMLAAHRNNHEIVQIFLSRGQNIDPPHLDICSCLECKAQREDDSLMFERSRLNTYRAFASPAFMALTFSDPVKEAFALAQTLRKYSLSHKEFKEEYIELAEQCMNFAIEIMNLCRSAKEVNAMLSDLTKEKNRTVIDPLAVIKDGLKYSEKRFISHPNCQMHCMKYFYQQLAFIQHLNLGTKLVLLLMFAPLLLPLSALYIIYPNFQIIVPKIGHSDSAISMPVKRLLNCPVVKFLSHSVSYVLFLTMLVVATFRVGSVMEPYKEEDTEWEKKADLLWSFDIRDSAKILSALQWCILGWLFGHFWMECKEIYNLGAYNYLESYYNVLDSLSMMLYMASFACRIVAASKVSESELRFKDDLAEMKRVLFDDNLFFGNYGDNRTTITGLQFYQNRRKFLLNTEVGYWLRGCRSWWLPDDPEIVSDCCFAIANWLSFARATFMMPAWEALGPLQISLSRMVSQIARFITILVLFLLAFVVAMTNLYWYYAKDVDIINAENVKNFHVRATDTNKMGNLRSTLMNLYWTLFGMTQPDIIETKLHAIKSNESSSFYYNENYTIDSSTEIMDSVGMLMFATYTGFMIIILMNMLIATMSHQYEVVQTAADSEWRYARCKLWMWYIDQEGCLPVPLNLIPDVKTFKHIGVFLKELLSCQLWKQANRGEEVHGGLQIAKRLQYNPQSFADALEGAKKKAGQKQEDVLAKLKSNLRRRFLFHLQGLREEKAAERHYQLEEAAAENEIANPGREEYGAPQGAVTIRRSASNVSNKQKIKQPPPSPDTIIHPVGSVIFGVPKDSHLPQINEHAPVAFADNLENMEEITEETENDENGVKRIVTLRKLAPRDLAEDANGAAGPDPKPICSVQVTQETITTKKGGQTQTKQVTTTRTRTIERLLMPASMRDQFLGAASAIESSEPHQDPKKNKNRSNSESAPSSRAGTLSPTKDLLQVKTPHTNRVSAPVTEIEKNLETAKHRPDQTASQVPQDYSSRPPTVGFLASSSVPYPASAYDRSSRLSPPPPPPPPVSSSPGGRTVCPYPLADFGVPPLPDAAIDVVAGSPGHALGSVFEESNQFGFADFDESGNSQANYN